MLCNVIQQKLRHSSSPMHSSCNQPCVCLQREVQCMGASWFQICSMHADDFVRPGLQRLICDLVITNLCMFTSSSGRQTSHQRKHMCERWNWDQRGMLLDLPAAVKAPIPFKTPPAPLPALAIIASFDPKATPPAASPLQLTNCDL